MKRYIITIALTLTTLAAAMAQGVEQGSKAGVVRFVNAVKQNDKAKLARQVAYPLNRTYPVPDIRNEKEFMARYEELFDDSLRRMITRSNLANDWFEMGWRGIMLLDGRVWLNEDGKLMAINYQTAKELNKSKELARRDRDSLHASLQRYKQPECMLVTKTYRVRIDEMSDGTYRYASWKAAAPISSKPDLVLTSGEYFPEGSSGNHSYQFTKGDHIYICSILYVGKEDSAPATLTIYKGDEEILSQNALRLEE